ncbi:MAG TPA: hypothetical protein VND92_08530 [Vicinamibacterales bacterium]|nr:hypothetical protein [Vicinamibacterales bacterium]
MTDLDHSLTGIEPDDDDFFDRISTAAPAAPLGTHEGYPILAVLMIVNKTGDGLSRAMEVAPHFVDVDSEAYLSVKVRHRKSRYDNVYDKHGEILGVNLVQIFDAVGATFDERGGEDVDDTIRAVAELKERRRAEKAGQGTLPLEQSDEGDRE